MKKLLLGLGLLWTLQVFSQPDVAAMNSYLAKSLKDWGIPGMAVAIVKDGKVVLSKGFGVKKYGSRNPVDENTLFAIASNTKAFVATALGDLVDQGKLDWNDRVVDYLPYFELYDPYVTQETRIVDLLCHRVGLGTFSGDMMWYKSSLTVPEIIQKIKYVPQAFGFRNGYGYSNLMFLTAGEVIKTVSGVEWDEYIREHYFQPLGMSRTITSTDLLPTLGNYAIPHKPFEDKVQPVSWVAWEQSGAAGGILSNVKDMSAWIQMNLDGGIWKEDTLIKKEIQNKLWTPHNNYVLSEKARKSVPGRNFAGYGLGWVLGDYYGNLVVSHSGGYDGMYSRVMMLPDMDLGIVILTNSMKGNTLPLCYYIVNQYIEKDNRDWSAEWLENSKANNDHAEAIDSREKNRKKKIKPILEPDAYTGTFYSGMHGKVYIKMRDDELRMEFEDNPGYMATLTHWHYNIWQINWDQTHAWFDFGTVQFLMNNDLEINGLHFDVPNYDIFFDEVDLRKL